MRKRRNTVMAASGLAIVLFLQASIILGNNEMRNLRKNGRKPEKPLFLADSHENAGVVCNDCHRETPPKDAVSTAVCLGCHEGYGQSEYVHGGNPDPHNSHLDFTGCEACHHAHKASENQCEVCHDGLEFQIP